MGGGRHVSVTLGGRRKGAERGDGGGGGGRVFMTL